MRLSACNALGIHQRSEKLFERMRERRHCLMAGLQAQGAWTGLLAQNEESYSAIVVLMCPVWGSARAAAAREALGGDP